MQIILSKKGFDSTYGGKSSLIMGKWLISIPIPDKNDSTTYGQLRAESGLSFFGIVSPYCDTYEEDGKRRNFTAQTKCHADPNLTNYFAASNFIGTFGQEKRAQEFLASFIKKGDLFLFFGWYKEVDNGRRMGRDKNVIFGYLQVGEIVDLHGLSLTDKIALEARLPWIADNPHWHYKHVHNCIYIAAPTLSFDSSLSGHGVFKYKNELDLTDPYRLTRTESRVKKLAGLKIINENGKSVIIENDGAFTMPRTYGQEFLIQDNPQHQAEHWAKWLITGKE